MSDCSMDLRLAILEYACLTLLLSMLAGPPFISESVSWLLSIVVSALAAVVVASVSNFVVVVEGSEVVVVTSSSRNENMQKVNEMHPTVVL